MTTTQKRPLLPRGWQMCKASLCGKQNSDPMPMHISGSSSYGSMAVCTMATCSCRCFNTLEWPAKVPMNVQFTGAKESHFLSGTSWQNISSRSSILTPTIKTSKPCVTMSMYYAGYPAKAGAKSRWQSSFARRLWLQSKITSGFISHPGSRQNSRCSGWLKITGMLSPPPTKRLMRIWWHLQGRPNNEPFLWLQSWKKRGVIPLATNTPLTANALPAMGGPDSLDGEKKVSGQFHSIRELRPDQKVPRWPHAMGNWRY